MGQAQPTCQEGLYDARLFNRDVAAGPDITVADDDEYALYDKPLFEDRSAVTGVYRFDRDRVDRNVGS